MAFYLVNYNNSEYMYDTSDRSLELVKDASILKDIKYHKPKMKYQIDAYLFPLTIYNFFVKSEFVNLCEKDSFKFWGTFWKFLDTYSVVLPSRDKFYERDYRLKYYAKYKKLGGITNAFLVMLYEVHWKDSYTKDISEIYYIFEYYNNTYYATRLNFRVLGMRTSDAFSPYFSASIGLNEETNCIKIICKTKKKFAFSYFYKGSFHWNPIENN